MLGFEFKGLTDLQKGYLSLFFGFILLLHTFNFFREWLNSIFIIAALLFIAYGIIKTRLIETILAFIQKEGKQKPIEARHKEKS